MVRPRPVSWLRDHPRAADALLAALIATISLVFHLTERGEDYHDPSVWGALLTLAATAPIAWRRHHPLQVLVVVTSAQMLAEGFKFVGAGWSGVLVASYTAGSVLGSRVAWRVVLVLMPLLFAFVTWGWVRGDAPWQAIISAPVMFGGAMVLGDNMRRRREHIAELAERAERAERERELLAHQRLQDERTRIARELHDVVAHSVSLMVIQAAAARRQLPVDPRRADEALATVELTGREAMTEMRRILGVLRGESKVQELEPQPSLADFDHLTASAPDLPVTVHAEGALTGLPSGVELSAYRIVQEALTNVRRHAGTVHAVDVSLVRKTDALVVEVNDDGRGASVTPNGVGFGIVGMRERVAAFDGELSAGPRGGGGWRVRATFPLVSA
ncbi:MAG: sensor histidine kinase [Actinobacteria bacterium]|nr:sensor histidine kinase [Actinomycetota bacterium]